jgi:hypothetical protein
MGEQGFLGQQGGSPYLFAQDFTKFTTLCPLPPSLKSLPPFFELSYCLVRSTNGLENLGAILEREREIVMLFLKQI